MTRSRGVSAVLSAVVFTLTAACSGGNAESKQAQPPKRPAVPVAVATVESKEMPVQIQAIGTVEAYSVVSVKAQVGGELVHAHVKEGQDVRKGDLLFSIDPRTYEAALAQAQANVAKDRVQVQQARAVLQRDQARVAQARANLVRDQAQATNAQVQEKRYADLLQKELVSREQYDQVRTTAESLTATVRADEADIRSAEETVHADEAAIRSAEQTVRADEAAVDNARLQLGYTTIRSPLDGRMGRADVRVGSLVGRSDSTLLATVSTLDPMYVIFSVSEREALSVWRQMPARVGGSPITITLPDDSVYPHGGRLDFVDRAVDPRTGTLALRATFPNPARVLRPGQYLRLRVLLEERADALVVPQAAIQESQGSTTLFVVAPDRTVQTRTVRTGPRVGTAWVVEEGVKPGEHVVVRGLQQIRAGMRVEPTLEALPPTPGS
jgi:multidrug efflux system membrane fusion protein